ncbi:MAG TPA: NAD-dependent epimerase/dehydratase family protein [Chitinophagales bacterium]|nr:NAD-dependent epimerase/dehydratase family protein [Chitinophagales bacterium]
MPKIAVVTGASGHIGFHVAKLLLEKNYETHLLIRSVNANVAKLAQAGAQVHQVNLFEPATYSAFLSNADVLFHLAAENTTSVTNAASVLENTDKLTQTVLNTALDVGIKTIIYTSSVVVLGRSHSPEILLNEKDIVRNPESPYVQGKLLAEQFVATLIKDKNVDIRSVYPSWVVGDNDTGLTPPHKVIKDFLAKGAPVYFDGGISIADVTNVAEGHVNAYEKGSFAQQYVLSGDNITFKRFYEILSDNSNQQMPKIKMPKWVIFIASWIFTKLFKMFGKEFPISPQYVRSVVGSYSWYDCSKAKKDIDYQTKPVEDILKNAIQNDIKRELGLLQLGKRNTLTNTATSSNEADHETLLITGVPGWLGNRMVDILINGDRFGNWQSSRKVRLMVEPRFKGLLNLPDNFEVVYADITNKNQVTEAVKNVVTVFHLAGAIYPKHVDVLYKVNEVGTKNLVDACIENKVRRMIFMSTDSTCGYGTKEKPVFDENTLPNPYKNYGNSKWLAEEYLLQKTREGKIDGTSLRGFWFFGSFAPERQMNFVNMFYWPRQIVFGNGKNLRSISHVDNIIEAFFQAEKNPKTYGQWYWIGNEQPHPTVDDIYKNIASALGVPYKPLYVPKMVCRLMEKTDTFMGKFNRINSTIQAAGKFDYDIAGNIDKAQRDFGYQPKIDLKMASEELAVLTKKNKK